MDIFKVTITKDDGFQLSYCAHDDDFEFMRDVSAEELEFMLRLRQFIIDEESRVEIKQTSVSSALEKLESESGETT